MQLLWWSIGLSVLIGFVWGLVFAATDSSSGFLTWLFYASLIAPTTMYSVAVIALGVRLGLGRR